MLSTTRAALAAIVATLTLLPVGAPSGVAQEATPTMTYSCETVMASPTAGMADMAMSTPAAESGQGHDMADQNVEFDQLYIDMMLPHHTSIIALAQVAQERLTDERLLQIADDIITTQSAENEELRGYREQWYGSADPMPMDEAMMGMMMEMMPGMGDMAEMQQQMDPAALVAAFCAGEDPDVTFIDMVTSHHEMAIAASEAALEQATQEEIRVIAERVIQAQQAENDELEGIRAELTGSGTPAA